MDLQQVSLKFFIENPGGADQSALIPIFHRWIREDALGEELLIDVADYRHVPEGPGVMIIGHEAHYGLDATGGELGLLFSRRRDALGAAEDRLAEAFKRTLRAGSQLESESELGWTFATDRFEVGVLSRLVAPNTAATFDAFSPELEAFVGRRFPDAKLEQRPKSDDPRAPFVVSATLKGTGWRTLSELAATLGPPNAALS